MSDFGLFAKNGNTIGNWQSKITNFVSSSFKINRIDETTL